MGKCKFFLEECFYFDRSDQKVRFIGGRGARSAREDEWGLLDVSRSDMREWRMGQVGEGRGGGGVVVGSGRRWELG